MGQLLHTRVFTYMGNYTECTRGLLNQLNRYFAPCMVSLCVLTLLCVELRVWSRLGSARTRIYKSRFKRMNVSEMRVWADRSFPKSSPSLTYNGLTAG